MRADLHLLTDSMFTLPTRFSFILLIALGSTVIAGWVNYSLALVLGLAYSLLFGNPFQIRTQWASALILKASVVFMGFGLNISEILSTLQSSFVLTITTIFFALTVGLALGKLLGVENKLSFLIGGGTAICGGSAIAALAPAIQAKPTHLLVSITVVFLLNAVGLLVYPIIGETLSLSQREFALWAALGIHDTSSVVGAAASFGDEALKIATTTKLARALWIIPLVFIAGFAFRHQHGNNKFPLFILFFVLASLGVSFIDALAPLTNLAPTVAKKGMALSLFLIGAGVSKETFSEIKIAPLWQGIILWILVSLFSLWLIRVF